MQKRSNPCKNVGIRVADMIIILQKSSQTANFAKDLGLEAPSLNQDNKKIENQRMVIQRWQSVLLLITVALMACFTFLSLGQVQAFGYSYNFTTLGFSIEGEPSAGSASGTPVHTWFLFIVSLMSVVIPLINIFMYKNLPLQKRLCLIEILFLLATICIAGWEGYRGIPGYECQWSALAMAPFMALILMVFSWGLINRDHKLIRSADRIR